MPRRRTKPIIINIDGIPVPHKKCSKCKTVKLLYENFYYFKKRDYYYAVCNACRSKQQEKYRTKRKYQKYVVEKIIDGKTVLYKKCTMCNRTKSLVEKFYYYEKRKYFCSVCSDCQKKQQAIYRKNIRKKNKKTKPIPVPIPRVQLLYRAMIRNKGKKLKYCPNCGNYYSLSEFIIQRGTEDGHMEHCKYCVNKRPEVKIIGRPYVPREYNYIN